MLVQAQKFSSRSSRVHAHAGWLLIGLIVVSTAKILALVGVTFFLTEHLRATSLQHNQTRAFYFAQAGVMKALYDFRQNTGIQLVASSVANPALTPGATEDAFVLQSIGAGNTAQADFLLMNMRNNVSFPQASFCSATRDRMEGWSVLNVLWSGGVSFVIDSFKVNWSPAGGEGILRLDLDGTGADWQAPGCVAVGRDTSISLAGVAVANRTLSPDERWATNRIWFTSTTMDGKDWIEVTFTLSDGSSRTAHWDRVTLSHTTADTTVTSIGEARANAFPFVAKRQLRAICRICATVSGTACDAEAEERQQPMALISYLEP